jgi:tetratricopeptide (TPR) repeat protein
LIYWANTDQIKDPDLIYQGQVLTIDTAPSASDVDAAIQHAKTRGSLSLGVVAGSGIESTYADHTRAVELARRGQYEQGLNILRPLLERFPDNYPLQRDVILITIWKGDCEEALQRFEEIPHKDRLEPYFIVKLSHCLVEQSQFPEAIELIQSGLERYPEHPDLQQALVRVKHTQAIALARAGNYDEGLTILESLLIRFPDNYPLQRDAILITIWKGDCEDAVQRFHGLSGQPAFEPYFIIPVSDCLLATNRPLEAITLVRSGLEQYPEHKGLEHALAKAMIAYRIDKRTDAGYPVIGVTFSLEPSEKGLREWLTELQASTKIAERTRLYARYLISRSSESEYEAGELDRLGVGIRYHFNEQFSIAQEFSTDIQKSNQGGSNTELHYQPYDTWTFAGGYTTFAENIPLRARANDIDAKGWYGSAVYDSTDYVWHWRLITSQYDFSDDNLRTSFFTTAGFAFEMLPHREQRLFLEWYQSQNTRDDAPYFNPKRDRSVGLVHKTDFVFESRFLRHVDHLYLRVGAYTQEGYGTHSTWGVRYEQDYDFDETQALVFSIGVNRNIYDGEPEVVGHFGLNYKKRF